jgi:hypothetical protein
MHFINQRIVFAPPNRYIARHDAPAHHHDYPHYPARPGTVGRGLKPAHRRRPVSGEAGVSLPETTL